MQTPPPSRRPITLTIALAGLALVGLMKPDRGAEATTIQGPRPTLDGGIDWINTDRPIHLDKLRARWSCWISGRIAASIAIISSRRSRSSRRSTRASSW